jgi:hypothetical protein
MSSKPPPNLTQAESAIAPSENYLGDQRHVAHEICAGINSLESECYQTCSAESSPEVFQPLGHVYHSIRFLIRSLDHIFQTAN